VSRRKSPKGLCVYCGVNPATTRDHVIPECLFVPPLPSNMVTVPACADCNTTKKSQDDPYLRDMLVYDSGRPLPAGYARLRQRQLPPCGRARVVPG